MMQQFRNMWLKDSSGVIVAMRYSKNKGFNGLCVRKQSNKIQVRVILLTEKWIDNDYPKGYANQTAAMTK